MQTACAPSVLDIQTAIAQTQTAMPTQTPTQTHTPTLTPTSTLNPCSDRGWTDIAIYLNQFDQEEGEMAVGAVMSAFLDKLDNSKNKINDVKVDACTEHARQLIINGLGNKIYAFKLIFNDPQTDKALKVRVDGIIMIKNAIKELEGLGIY